MRGAIAVVGLACFGLLAWLLAWLLLGLATSEPIAPSDAGPPAGSAGHRTAMVSTPVDAMDVGQTKDAAATSDLETERELATEIRTTSPANLRVIEFGSKQPVANAQVFYMPPDFDWQALKGEEQKELQMLAQADYEAYLRKIGVEVHTDRSGECCVPVGASGTQLVVRRGDLFAQSYIAAKQQGVTVVTLRLDQTLQVRVVDAMGEPAAGIVVSVALKKPPSGDQVNTWHLGKTDANGHLAYSHCQALDHAGVVPEFEVKAVASGCVSPSVTVDVWQPPVEVVLRLPPTGMVQVHLLDQHRKPLDTRYLAGASRVRLATFDEEPVLGNTESDGFNRSGVQATIEDNGVATFRHIALGKFVIARFDYYGVSARGAGPTSSNQAVSFEIREQADAAIFTGVLETAAQGVVANQEFKMTYRGDGGMGSGSGRTDEQGKFRVNRGVWVVGKQCVLSFQLQGAAGANSPAVELPAQTVRAGIHDLGRVVLAEARVLLAGRIVKDSSIDATKVHVQIERREGEHWQQEWNLHLAWQDDGTFALRGAMPVGEALRLVVAEGAYLAVPPIECHVGDTAIEIPLRQAGSAAATFLVDDSVPVQQLRCRLTKATSVAASADAESLFAEYQSQLEGPEQNGRMAKHWHGLSPGKYVLTVVCHGTEQEVLRIDAIEVGTTANADARLTDIDLRGRVRKLEIAALGSDGVAIADASAFVIARNASSEWRGYHLGKGKVDLASVAAVDLLVVAKGYEMATVSAVTKSQTIPLQACRTCSVKLQLPVALPDDVQLILQLSPVLGHDRRGRISLDTGRGMMLDHFFVEELAMAADGTVTVPVRWPGDYTVAATLTGDGRQAWSLRDWTPKMLTLPATGAVLEVSSTALQRVLDRLAKK